jgi:transposase
MLKTLQYRLYPTKRQERLLTEQGEEVRWLWNTLLAERTIAWEERPEAVLYYDQQNALPTLKTTLRPPFALPSPSPRPPLALPSLKSTPSLCKMSSAVCRRRWTPSPVACRRRWTPSPVA